MTTLLQWSLLLLVAIAVPLHASGPRGHERLPDVEPPQQSRSEWIVPSMVHNGLRMQVRRFRTSLSTEAVIEHHDQVWNHRWPEERTSTTSIGAWSVISVRPPEFFISVKARRIEGETVGYITVSEDPAARLDGDTTRPRLPLAIPRDVDVLNRQRYDDAGRNAETIVIRSPRSPVATADRFRNHFRDTQWQDAGDERRSGDRRRDGLTQFYRRDDETMYIHFARSDNLGTGTTALIIWTGS